MNESEADDLPRCRFCGVPTPKEDLDKHGECPPCRSWSKQNAKEEAT